MEEPCPAASSEGTPKDGSSTSPWRPTGVRSRAPMRRAVSWVLRGLRDHRAKPDRPEPLAPPVPQVRRVTEATPARKAIPETRDLPEQMDPRVLQDRLDRLVPPENEARWAKRVLRELMDHPAPLARSQGLLALRAMLAQQVHRDYRVLLAQPELKDPRAIRATSVQQVRLAQPVRKASPVVLVLPASLFRSEPS